MAIESYSWLIPHDRDPKHPFNKKSTLNENSSYCVLVSFLKYTHGKTIKTNWIKATCKQFWVKHHSYLQHWILWNLPHLYCCLYFRHFHDYSMVGEGEGGWGEGVLVGSKSYCHSIILENSTLFSTHVVTDLTFVGCGLSTKLMSEFQVKWIHL